MPTERPPRLSLLTTADSYILAHTSAHSTSPPPSERLVADLRRRLVAYGGCVHDLREAIRSIFPLAHVTVRDLRNALGM